MHRIAAIGAVAALTLTFTGVALAASYATVSTHEAFSSDANHASYWETNGLTCDKIYDGGGAEIDSWAADDDYAKVIVKAGAGAYANTIFLDVAKGEIVWADTNGNDEYDPGGKGGDKNISHIIVCNAVVTTTTETETTETTPTTTTTTTTTTKTTTTATTTTTPTTETETTSSTTTKHTSTGTEEAVTPPRTDTLLGSESGTVSTGVLLVLAGLLASALVVIPAAARRR